MAQAMKTTLHPLHDRILVQRIEEEKVRRSGIIIPDSAKEKPQEGKVLAVGKGTVNEDGTYVIQFALPGVDPKEVALSVKDNILTVKGERKANHDPAGKDYFVREVVYGVFQRSVMLPEGVDAAQAEAKYANGMLEVRVPAPRAAAPRMIEVKAA